MSQGSISGKSAGDAVTKLGHLAHVLALRILTAIFWSKRTNKCKVNYLYTRQKRSWNLGSVVVGGLASPAENVNGLNEKFGRTRKECW